MIDKLMADLEISKHKNRCGESMNYEKLVALHMYYFSLAWTMFPLGYHRKNSEQKYGHIEIKKRSKSEYHVLSVKLQVNFYKQRQITI